MSGVDTELNPDHATLAKGSIDSFRIDLQRLVTTLEGQLTDASTKFRGRDITPAYTRVINYLSDFHHKVKLDLMMVEAQMDTVTKGTISSGQETGRVMDKVSSGASGNVGIFGENG